MTRREAAPASKDDRVPNPGMERLTNLAHTLTCPPPWPEAILLGFQHYLVMLGTTVFITSALVPLMGGGNHEKARVIQTLQFVAGLNTLLQTLFGTRLPAVIGGSYHFVKPTIYIILADRYCNIVDPHERFERIIRGTQGALIVASTFQIIVGFSGQWRIFADLSSPLLAAPLVILVGTGLYGLGFPLLANCFEIGIPQLILLVVLSQYFPLVFPGYAKVFDRFTVLISVPIVWFYAHILTVGGAYDHAPQKTQLHCRTDRAGLVGGSPWIRIPYPFQWGAPTFDAGEVFAMMVASSVSLTESVGAFYAVSRYSGETQITPGYLGRGIGWQGVGILLSGLFGTANGSSVSVENAGLLGFTRVGSRRVVQIAAGFMIFFSVLGKFGAVFASIPVPIIAAIYCVLPPYVGVAGVSLLQFCNLNNFRNMFILGFSIFLGFSVPQYFKDEKISYRRWFYDIVNLIFSSGAFVAGVAAFSLANTLDPNNPAERRDRGSDWWPPRRVQAARTTTVTVTEDPPPPTPPPPRPPPPPPPSPPPTCGGGELIICYEEYY